MPEGLRLTAVTWVVAAVLATLALTRLLSGDGDGGRRSVQVTGAGGAGRVSAGPARSGEATGSRRARVAFVHVAGAVRSPGLLRVPSGSRVAVAIGRAGGPLPRADLSAVNLAARVIDGQQIVVPAPGTVGSAATSGVAGAGPGAAAAAGAKPSLAAATLEQLEELDGIGPTLAERIVEYRDAHGGFRSLRELGEVDGIGEKRLASLEKAVVP